MSFKIFNIESLAKENNFFRKVIHQNGVEEVTLQSVETIIPSEIHDFQDQLIIIVEGLAWACINGNIITNIKPGFMLIIEAGVKHVIINTLDEKHPLKFYTIYCPPEHKPGRIDI